MFKDALTIPRIGSLNCYSSRNRLSIPHESYAKKTLCPALIMLIVWRTDAPSVDDTVLYGSEMDIESRHFAVLLGEGIVL